MSSLKYNNPPGASTTYGDMCHYSQTVDLGNGMIKCAGQGGWNSETGELDANNQVQQVKIAFQNVDKILQAAGLRGWEDVYLVRTYHTDIRTTFQTVVDTMKERIPGHKPVWTCIGVQHLALPTMCIEIEVEAKRQEQSGNRAHRFSGLYSCVELPSGRHVTKKQFVRSWNQ